MRLGILFSIAILLVSIHGAMAETNINVTGTPPSASAANDNYFTMGPPIQKTTANSVASYKNSTMNFHGSTATIGYATATAYSTAGNGYTNTGARGTVTVKSGTDSNARIGLSGTSCSCDQVGQNCVLSTTISNGNTTTLSNSGATLAAYACDNNSGFATDCTTGNPSTNVNYTTWALGTVTIGTTIFPPGTDDQYFALVGTDSLGNTVAYNPTNATSKIHASVTSSGGVVSCAVTRD